MHNPFDTFGGVYCINLDSRPDRWEKIQSVFNDYEINNVQRFPGVVCKSNLGDVRSNKLGCALSFYRILRDAQERGFEKILILEDDCKFLYSKEENANYLSEFLTALPEGWDMLYLGVNLISDYGFPIARFSDVLFRVFAAYTTHSIAFSKKGIEKFLLGFDNEEDYGYKILELYHSIDQFLIKGYLRNHNCFIGNKMLTSQTEGFSDIEMEYVSEYTKILLERFDGFAALV